MAYGEGLLGGDVLMPRMKPIKAYALVGPLGLLIHFHGSLLVYLDEKAMEGVTTDDDERVALVEIREVGR